MDAKRGSSQILNTPRMRRVFGSGMSGRYIEES